uniref:RRM domain-containing protein n=1 Tax=Steinernema glaseri TaxID=37863 RepID=A0A1I7Y638_9BILA
MAHYVRTSWRQSHDEDRFNSSHRNHVSVFDRLSRQPRSTESNILYQKGRSEEEPRNSSICHRENRSSRSYTANQRRHYFCDRLDRSAPTGQRFNRASRRMKNRLVDVDLPLKPERESRTPRHERKVFVGNVPRAATEDDLLQHFSRYGTVQNVILPRNHGSLEHRKYGYVLFTEKDCLPSVLNRNYCHIIDGQELDVQPVMDKHSKEHIKEETLQEKIRLEQAKEDAREEKEKNMFQSRREETLQEKIRLKQAKEDAREENEKNMFQSRRVKVEEVKEEPHPLLPLPPRPKFDSWRLTQIELGLVEPGSGIHKEKEEKKIDFKQEHSNEEPLPEEDIAKLGLVEPGSGIHKENEERKIDFKEEHSNEEPWTPEEDIVSTTDSGCMTTDDLDWVTESEEDSDEE